jgi:hypothetical protein
MAAVEIVRFEERIEVAQDLVDGEGPERAPD